MLQGHKVRCTWARLIFHTHINARERWYVSYFGSREWCYVPYFAPSFGAWEMIHVIFSLEKMELMFQNMELLFTHSESKPKSNGHIKSGVIISFQWLRASLKLCFCSKARAFYRWGHAAFSWCRYYWLSFGTCQHSSTSYALHSWRYLFAPANIRAHHMLFIHHLPSIQ